MIIQKPGSQELNPSSDSFMTSDPGDHSSMSLPAGRFPLLFGPTCKAQVTGRPADFLHEKPFYPEKHRATAPRDRGRKPAAPGAGTDSTDQPGHRLRHRRGHLRRHRAGGPRQGRARHHAFVCGSGAGLCLRRAVLCRVRLDGSRGRVRLYLRLRDPRRTGGMDHRLGSAAGIHHCLVRRGPWLVAIFPGVPRHFSAPAAAGGGQDAF